MSLKLKAICLGIFATLAVGGFAAVNAGAEVGGHFVWDGDDHIEVRGTESGTHRLHFKSHGSEGEIGCEEASYHVTVDDPDTTLDYVDVTPTYKNCYTTPSGTKFAVHHDGCVYRFTVTKNSGNATEQDVHLICPAGGAITITHPNCTITVGPQTVDDAVTYTTSFENGKHTITMDVNAKFQTTYHGGICIFLGTNQVGTLSGSVTVAGFNTAGNEVNITAT